MRCPSVVVASIGRLTLILALLVGCPTAKAADLDEDAATYELSLLYEELLVVAESVVEEECCITPFGGFVLDNESVSVVYDRPGPGELKNESAAQGRIWEHLMDRAPRGDVVAAGFVEEQRIMNYGTGFPKVGVAIFMEHVSGARLTLFHPKLVNRGRARLGKSEMGGTAFSHSFFRGTYLAPEGAPFWDGEKVVVPERKPSR